MGTVDIPSICGQLKFPWKDQEHFNNRILT